MVLENSIEAVAIYYGALQAGAIFVPLNAAAKSRDFDVWLAHCGARFLFCDTSNAALRRWTEGEHALNCVHVGTGAAEVSLERILGAADTSCPNVAMEGTRPALIIYTSGTTGAPKGVLLSLANLAANTAAIVDYLELTERDRIVSILPLYYSYGSSVVHTHLAAGAEIVLEQNLIYPHVIVESLARHRATGFSGVPSTYALLLSRVSLRDHDLASLRYLTQAGGAMVPALTQRLRAAVPHVRLFVMYGQTEATARLTYLPPEDIERKEGSVGIAIRDTTIEVRNETGARCAPFEPGEVFVRGPGVMLGYWDNPGATADVLRDGWLKTGDLGYVDDEGYLYLSGRRSDMIKAGAHRVHPLDVEEVIQELDSVAEVAVVGVDDEMLGQAIKAFIVPRLQAELNLMHVKAHCRARLANYKIPKYIEVVAALPKTASGKVRRHELRDH
jgi:acyl-CoA synthetase (AMP-forming)/AMP-acid ligase II